MTYRRLYICVEGRDDELFFGRVVKPQLSGAYDDVLFFRYAEKSTKKCTSFLNSVRNIAGADVIWVCDNDRAPCVTVRREKVKERLQVKFDINIVVVVTEIEGWFLAGIGEQSSRDLRTDDLPNTDRVTKDTFLDMRPPGIRTNREFMLAILDDFSVETAQVKNRSFRYFCQKYICNSIQET